MPRPQVILPAFYYHDHFCEMVRLVVQLYSEMLGEAEKAFLENFPKLSLPAQCLYIRMINRKQTIFSIDDLLYAEIEDVVHALDELTDEGWVRGICEDDYKILLSEMKKDQLIALMDWVGCEDHKSSWKKDRLVSYGQDNISFSQWQDTQKENRLYIPEYTDTVRFLLFLYFGKMNDSLTSFALRDLGIVQTKSKESYSARFQDIDEARAGYFYSEALEKLKRGKTEVFKEYLLKIKDFPNAETEYARDLRNSTLFLIGQYFERQKQNDAALAVYHQSDNFACRERLVRLVYAEDKGASEQLLISMMEDPSSDEEFIFASDFYERKFGKKRTSSYTDLLRSGRSISVDEAFRGSPEQAALRHYKKNGWAGSHLENSIWNATFALLFWDELFEQEDSYGSGFDRIPRYLKSKEFYARHEKSVQAMLDHVRSGDAEAIISTNYARYCGIYNGLFGWFDGLLDILRIFVLHSPANGLADILERMAKDYFSMSDGFPDLLLVQSSKLKLVEIKAEGDQIRRSQMVRMQQLRNAGFEVEVLRVGYHVDPNQIYVVVDVETTGGRAPNDRVTEIGAVKVQNGKIIDEWSTLINPERKIPSFITGLTGISDAMVADAPVFAEVAEEFSEFLADAVFVAHNVNFDYGFISSEFRRSGYEFKMPKLCTCSSMRRHFPGHVSYSLATITKEYGISLPDHHRALCDARAAAELLRLINNKRIAEFSLVKAA